MAPRMLAGTNSGATAALRSPLGSPASADTPEALVRDSSEEPSEAGGGRGSGRSSASFRFARTPASGGSSGGNPFSIGSRWCVIELHDSSLKIGPSVHEGLCGARVTESNEVTKWTAVTRYEPYALLRRYKRDIHVTFGISTCALPAPEACLTPARQLLTRLLHSASRSRENAAQTCAEPAAPSSTRHQPALSPPQGSAGAAPAASNNAAADGLASPLRGMRTPQVAVDISLYEVSSLRCTKVACTRHSGILTGVPGNPRSVVGILR